MEKNFLHIGFTDLLADITSRNSLKSSPGNRDLWKGLKAFVQPQLCILGRRPQVTISY